jgi:prophage antirepressor-like protein
MNELQIFKNEAFGEIRTLSIDNEPWFVAKDVAVALGYSNPRDAFSKHVDKEDKSSVAIHDGSQNRNMAIINESGLYSLVLSSKLESAKQFKRWVTHDVLPTIRKTGGYVSNEDLFINIYLPFADEQTKGLFQNTLVTIRQQNELIQKQKKALEHKEDVIVGLTENISLAEKRQRISQIIRYNTKDISAIAKKWALFYSEFEKKYHVNLSVRLQNSQNKFKPKLKNLLDVIDRDLNMISEAYELCCKLFETDVKELVKGWELAIVS